MRVKSVQMAEMSEEAKVKQKEAQIKIQWKYEIYRIYLKFAPIHL